MCRRQSAVSVAHNRVRAAWRVRSSGRYSGSEAVSVVIVVMCSAFGAAFGFALHRFMGCRTGACPIWANPYAATFYGALLGLFVGLHAAR